MLGLKLNHVSKRGHCSIFQVTFHKSIFLNIQLGPTMTSSPRRRRHGLHNSDSSCDQIQCSMIGRGLKFHQHHDRIIPWTLDLICHTHGRCVCNFKIPHVFTKWFLVLCNAVNAWLGQNCSLQNVTKLPILFGIWHFFLIWLDFLVK